MKKLLTAVTAIALCSAVLFASFTFAEIALAASGQSTCTLNGQPISCEELASKTGGLLKFGLGIIGFIMVVGLIALIFWIAMIVHAINHPIEHKAVWILVLLLTGLLGAIVYYFAVKRPFAEPSPPPSPPPTAPKT